MLMLCASQEQLCIDITIQSIQDNETTDVTCRNGQLAPREISVQIGQVQSTIFRHL